jgi:hypothetical protein
MTSNNNTNILKNQNQNYRDGEKYQQCLKFGEHDYESINSQYISKNVVEVEYVCLECGDIKYVYNYLDDGDVL